MPCKVHTGKYDAKMQNAFLDFNILCNIHSYDTNCKGDMLNAFLINDCKNQDH